MEKYFDSGSSFRLLSKNLTFTYFICLPVILDLNGKFVNIRNYLYAQVSRDDLFISGNLVMVKHLISLEIQYISAASWLFEKVGHLWPHIVFDFLMKDPENFVKSSCGWTK